jgi:uncharacterized protein YjbJ (UPF0337 family)
VADITVTPDGEQAAVLELSGPFCSFFWLCTWLAGFIDISPRAPNGARNQSGLAVKPVVVENAPMLNSSPPRRTNEIALKEESPMKQSTKDKAKGKFHEVKGKVKEKVGRATNDPNMEAEGQGEQIGGKIRKKIGQVEKVLGM